MNNNQGICSGFAGQEVGAAVVPPKALRGIEVSLEELRTALSALEDAEQQLYTRLGPIMGPSSPQINNAEKSPEISSACELSGWIDKQTTLARRVVSRLWDIIDRVQI